MAEITYNPNHKGDDHWNPDAEKQLREKLAPLRAALSTGRYRIAPRDPHQNFASPKNYTLRLEEIG